jgi:hypothetical protein
MSLGKNLAFAYLILGFSAMACSDDESDGDDDSSPSCAVASDACVDDCIRSECGAEIDACADDAMCDAAKDEMVSCVCSAQRAGEPHDMCLATFTDTGGILSTPFSYCATLLCSDPCGL